MNTGLYVGTTLTYTENKQEKYVTRSGGKRQLNEAAITFRKIMARGLRRDIDWMHCPFYSVACFKAW